MSKIYFLLALVWVVLGNGCVTRAQTPSLQGVKAAPVNKNCAVNSSAPDAAETALNQGHFSQAEGLFREILTKNPNAEAAQEAEIRALIAQNKVADAALKVESWTAAAPGSSMAMVALGETRLRQGDPRSALAQYQRAMQTDPCNARAYFAFAHLGGLEGFHATARRLIEKAYAIHPTDDDIYTAWIASRPRKMRLARWADYAEHSAQISDEERAKLKKNVQKQSLDHASDCRAAASSPGEAAVPIVRVMDGPLRFVAWGLDVDFNGQRRRLEIDTGASGITISRMAANSLGIQGEDAESLGGIGDRGRVKTSVAHLASIKIGAIEFTNCAVEIVEKASVLDTAGLIGADVFGASLVTLDFPKRQLRVAPLPERPGEKKVAASSNAGGEDEVVALHDPYVAPEMAKWERIYRSGHNLLMPTWLADTRRVKDPAAWKERLFLLDTGSQSNLISRAAAKEVTKVERDSDMRVIGISGQVANVYAAGRFTLAFAGLRVDSPSMTSIDTTNISSGVGLEVSGLIGAPALFQVVMHIDYRDNLVWCEYTKR